MTTYDHILEHINKEYAHARLGEFHVIMMVENGYINATKICEKYGKLLKNWTRNKDATELISKIEEHVCVNIMIKNMKGPYETRGTYVHPLLVTPIALWISPKFGAKVSIWIEEWKKFDEANRDKYYHELANLEPSRSSLIESSIQQRLCEELGGEIEIKTPAGRIDVLSDSQIIEVKKYRNWKHGIGQLIAYATYVHDRDMHLYLFCDADTKRIDDVIRQVCDKNDIILTIEEV